MTKKPRKTRLWQVDTSLFQPARKVSFFQRRIIDPSRSLVRYLLYAVAFAYPVTLVSLGIIFGGLVFWTSLVGSAGLIWLVIKKAGYARNFEAWDLGYKKLLGLVMGFGIALAFYTSIINLKTWAVPIIAGILTIAFVLGMRRISSQ